MAKGKMVGTNAGRNGSSNNGGNSVCIQVDPINQWRLKQYKYSLNHNGYVVRRTSYRKGNRIVGKNVFLHHEVLEMKPPKDWHKQKDPLTVDHKDGDPTNNKIENLEIVPLSVNIKRKYKR